MACLLGALCPSTTAAPTGEAPTVSLQLTQPATTVSVSAPVVINSISTAIPTTLIRSTVAPASARPPTSSTVTVSPAPSAASASDTSTDTSSSTTVVAIVVPVVLGILIIIGAIIWVKKRQAREALRDGLGRIKEVPSQDSWLHFGGKGDPKGLLTQVNDQHAPPNEQLAIDTRGQPSDQNHPGDFDQSVIDQWSPTGAVIQSEFEAYDTVIVPTSTPEPFQVPPLPSSYGQPAFSYPHFDHQKALEISQGLQKTPQVVINDHHRPSVPINYSFPSPPMSPNRPEFGLVDVSEYLSLKIIL